MTAKSGFSEERLYSSGRANVERLAEETGGKAWWSDKKNYSEAVSGIANCLASQYLVTFVPASTTPGTHALRVKADIGSGRTSAPNAFIVVPPPTAK